MEFDSLRVLGALDERTCHFVRLFLDVQCDNFATVGESLSKTECRITQVRANLKHDLWPDHLRENRQDAALKESRQHRRIFVMRVTMLAKLTKHAALTGRKLIGI